VLVETQSMAVGSVLVECCKAWHTTTLTLAWAAGAAGAAAAG
jgi:hypothetical protein